MYCLEKEAINSKLLLFKSAVFFLNVIANYVHKSVNGILVLMNLLWSNQLFSFPDRDVAS